MGCFQPTLTAFVVRLFLLVQNVDFISSGPASANLKPASNGSPPNIVIILADDMGFDDVSFHGSQQIPTVNIDKLAKEGIIFNRFYSQPTCTPSRAALLTGKYPFKMGMQGDPIISGEPWGLPLGIKLLPQYMKDLGYSTHMIGKWHLGEYKSAFFPHNRGFETFLGTPEGLMDYFDYTHQGGYELYNNSALLRRPAGVYATDLFSGWAEDFIHDYTDPRPFLLYVPTTAPRASATRQDFGLQAAATYLNRSSVQAIKDPQRQKYAAMVQALDEAVGRIHQALVKKQLTNNTLVWFISDNGGPVVQPGTFTNSAPTSNWPLRGCKNTLYEGGVRVAAMLWGPKNLINTSGRVSHQLLHITDLIPTLYRIAGGNPATLEGLDGFDQWDNIRGKTSNEVSARSSVPLDINNQRKSYGLIWENYKVIKGNFFNGSKEGNGWNIPAGTSAKTPRNNGPASLKCKQPTSLKNFTACDTKTSVCLFDVVEDPCENDNLATKKPEIVQQMLEMLHKWNESYVAPINKPIDPESAPALHGGAWVPWLEDSKTA